MENNNKIDVSGITNITLAENSVLQDKMNYIKDLIEDFCSEHKKDKKIKRKCFIKLVSNIYHVVINKTCGTCKWHQQEDITKGMVCVNSDAEECANWTDSNFSCNAYEVDEEWAKKFGKETK